MVLMIGLALAVMFLFVVLVVLLLIKKRSPNAVQNSAPSQIVEVFRPSQHVTSFRQQMKQEQAEAMASVYADQIEKQFLADTITDAQAKLAAWKPV